MQGPEAEVRAGVRGGRSGGDTCARSRCPHPRGYRCPHPWAWGGPSAGGEEGAGQRGQAPAEGPRGDLSLSFQARAGGGAGAAGAAERCCPCGG